MSEFPSKAPTNFVEAVIVVPVIAAAEFAPIIVPSIAPPSMSTALLACTERLPKPNPVLAPPASVAPVPPFATGKAPVTSAVRSIAPADIVPELTLIIPVDELKFCPVPPYCEPITVPFQAPAATVPNLKSSRVVPSL